MEELMAKLQGILGSPEGQEQLKNIQNMLSGGQGEADAVPVHRAEEAAPSTPPPNGQGGFDFSALAGMLGNLGGAAPAQGGPPPAGGSQTGGFDLSALAGVLGGLKTNGGSPAQATQTAAPDLSGLMGALTGGQAGGAPGMPNIDLNMILKLQRVFQTMNQANDKDTQLLMALKPHFSPKRQAKVDQAMSMMRLFSMLPALRESGIFAGL